MPDWSFQKFSLAFSSGASICFRMKTIRSAAAEPAADGAFELCWTPEFAGTVNALGAEVSSAEPCRGKAQIDFIAIGGIAKLVSERGDADFSAWISSMAGMRTSSGMRQFNSNEEPGVLVTGNRTWGDTHVSAEWQIHAADRAGILVHYQGLCRWIGVIFSRQDLRIVRSHYGEETLAKTDFVCRENELMQLDVSTRGNRIEVRLDGKLLLTAEDDVLSSGGAGIYVDHGRAGFGRFAVEAAVD